MEINECLIEYAGSSNNDIDEVKKLLKAGVPVDKKSQYTPLHKAAERGNTNIVALLLEMRAKVNAKGDWGNTPLHLAARNGHADVVALLIQKGAKVNMRNVFGDTPLHEAAEESGNHSHLGIVTLLIKKGANVNMKDINGQTAHDLSEEGDDDSANSSKMQNLLYKAMKKK